MVSHWQIKRLYQKVNIFHVLNVILLRLRTLVVNLWGFCPSDSKAFLVFTAEFSKLLIRLNEFYDVHNFKQVTDNQKVWRLIVTDCSFHIAWLTLLW